jgi:flagellar biosynthesis GTPase FlhF
VFEDAQEKFLNALAPAESARFKRCSSAEELLKSAQELDVIAKDRIRGRGFMSRIKSFNDSLAPYFGVIEVVISSNPEYAAIAWGSIRLALQLASNYSSFFDKLTQSLARLGHHLPQGQIIEQIYRSQHRQEFPECVKNALCQVYVEVFEFLQNVARVFSKNNGKYKRRPRVAFGLAWKPFNSRFGGILQQLESNANTLKDVVNLDQIQASVKEREEAAKERKAAEEERVAAEKEKKATELAKAKSESERKALFEKFEKEEEEEAKREERAEEMLMEQKALYAEVSQRLMDTEVLKESMERTEQKVYDLKLTIEKDRRKEAIDGLRTWISPPQYMQEYEKALSERENGTADWFIQSQMFEKWKTSATKSRFLTGFGDECLWVQGSPGYGKTVLAAAAVDGLQYTSDDSVLYFFFRSGITSMQFSLSAYRSIAAQILQHHRADHDIIDKFIFAMDQESGGQLVASRNELLELIRVYLRTPGRSYIILDGVDECEDNHTLVQDLLAMRFESEAKVLFFSRPYVAKLLHVVPEEYHLLVGKKTATDIGLYLKRKVASLKEETLLPPSADVDNLVANLEIGADGMFLWARLMMRYLSSPALSKQQRLKIIRDVTFPEGLEAMYDRIGALIENGFEVEKDLAKQVVIWLAFAKRQITTRELQEAVQSDEDDAETGEEEQLSDFIQRVVMTCAGLVEIENMYDPVQRRSTDFFRFIHLSAKEYFSGEEGVRASHDKGHFLMNPCQANILITRTCLEYLTFALPAQPLGGDVGCSANQRQLVQAFPLSIYAALHWSEHLVQGVPIDDSDSSIREMFNSMLHSLSRFLGGELVLMAWIEALYICGGSPVSTHLDKWSHCVEFHSIPGAEEVEVKDILEDVKELSRYLRELDDFWGAKLVKNPECIWEEVVAFTPCRLLARTRAVQVHSLVADPPDDDYLSTTNLCKLSKASSNGLLAAVVSIWPSRYVIF